MGRMEEAVTLCKRLCRQQPANSEAWFSMGVLNAQAGQFDEASGNFQRVLELSPQDAEAYFNLGKIAAIQGQFNKAIDSYQQAIYINPDLADAYNNLGNLLYKRSQLSTAAEYLANAVKLQPHNTSFLCNYASTLEGLGEFDNALKFYRQAIDINPGLFDAFYYIGVIQQKLSHIDEAVESYQHVLRIKPDHVDAHINLAHCFRSQHQMELATSQMRAALAIKPDSPTAHLGLGLIHLEKNQLPDAITHYKMALHLQPDLPEAYLGLGNAMKDLLNFDQAIDYYKKALALRKNFPEAHNNLGQAYQANGKIENAIRHYKRALQLKPNLTPAHHNLASAYSVYGDFSRAIEIYRRIVKQDPEFIISHSNLLFQLSYNVLCSPRDLLEESRQWDRMHGNNPRFGHKPGSDPNKRLRIGYVSPDLRQHAVSYFFEPILKNHDPQQVEVFCYAEVKNPDEVTRRLQGLAHHWRSTVGMSDAEAAQMIYNDNIDILVDLSGHTAHNRLRIFTFKPAPLQVTYLGYCATTGLDTMDYWITDEILHPADTTELATENIYRLPRCWLCYQPDPKAPPVSTRADGDFISFGSFNNLTKLTPKVIHLWSRILNAVPNSRLTLKTKNLGDPYIKRKLIDQFAAHGIKTDRLMLLTHTSEYLSAYHDIDIALDPFPRTGGATTADALWMGVPVVTLAGQRFIERQGVSMLSAVGLDDCIAESPNDYFHKAAALARDSGRRHALRMSLRERMKRSPLCDGKNLAFHMERAYREIWKNKLLSLR